jgi:hypothetical protein
MTRPTRLRSLSALAGLLCLTACFREKVAGGWTDTDTGTKISGLILREDGKPASGALVLLRPEDYLAKNPAATEDGDGTAAAGSAPSGGSLLDGQCDSAGRFAFDSVRAGRYALEARDREINGALLRFAAPKDADRMDLAPLASHAVGAVTGLVQFSDSVPGPVLVRIFGLEQAALADPATGRFRFPHVPAGTYTLHFSGLEPFIPALIKPGVAVSPDSLTDAGSVMLVRGLKQDFREAGGALDLPGVDSANPVIYENGAFINPVDGAYLWAKASMGRLDLRGVVVSYAKDTGAAALEANRRNCLGLMRLARLSGMRGFPDPVLGAARKLARPVPGEPADPAYIGGIRPEASEGSRLMIAEARKARPDRPLIVIGGANLTTVANALLLDPGIADRMIVFGTNNGNFNKEDSLAVAVVAKKARLVEWARDFTWADARLPTNTDAPRMGNRYAERLRAHRETDRTPGLWALTFFADFGAATYLYDRKVWRSAAAADWTAAPMVAAPRPAARAFDFVDVPLSATDWSAIQGEFYACINNPAAYHPWPISQGLMAEAYAADSGISVSAGLDGSGEAVIWKGPGSWVEYDMQADTAGTYALDLRFQSAAASSLRILHGDPENTVQADFPAGTGWDTLSIAVPLPQGRSTLRLECLQGSFTLDWIHPPLP